MNGRASIDETPEGRIAVVAKALCSRMEDRFYRDGDVGPKVPDTADFREVLRPFIHRELLNARIDEARKTASAAITIRVAELAKQLQCLKFPEGFDL